MRSTLFSSKQGDLNFNLALINNPAGTAAPGVGNDISQGYEPLSLWLYGGVTYQCTSNALGAATWVVLSDGSASPGQVIAPAASTPTGNGSGALLAGGTGGTTSGNGGPANVTGGAATSGNGNGGSVVLAGGAKNGTGNNGAVRIESLRLLQQAAPAAKTVSATLTPAEVLGGLLTVNQGAGAGSTLTMPLGTDIEAALPGDQAVGDSFDFSIINISVVDAEDATLAANTGVTLVGNVTIEANSAITKVSSGLFRCRRTAASTFVVYRLT